MLLFNHSYGHSLIKSISTSPSHHQQARKAQNSLIFPYGRTIFQFILINKFPEGLQNELLLRIYTPFPL
jgi:hypothetical protein